MENSLNEKNIIAQIRDLQDGEIDKWIEDRIAFLEENAVEDREEISTLTYTLSRLNEAKGNTEVQGYIPSKTRLKKEQFDISSFRMDDTSFYKTVIDYIKNANSEYIMRNGKINHNYIMHIIQRTIIDYLGSRGVEQRRNALYDYKGGIEDEPLSISDFKRIKETAMCVERSAMGQNILAFLGYDPMLIYGYMSSDRGIVNEAHAYNCVVNKNRGSNAN